MNSVKIIGQELPNMPWQDKPEDCKEVMWRDTHNPITKRNPTKTIRRISNSAVVPYEDGFVGVFRADQNDGRAILHFAKSKDGLNWDVDEDEIQWKDELGNSYQPVYGYDPRVVKLEDEYYIVWCGDFGGGPTLHLGQTKDFKEFTRLENIFVPFNRNGVLFPRKINGSYRLLSRPSDGGHTAFGDIFISESKDLVHWGKHRKLMSRGGTGWWQMLKIGGGPVPIETTEGWLIFYHGVIGTCNGYVYSIGAALLDIDTPSKVLYRTRSHILTPEEDYETIGFVPNVTFPTATLHDSKTGRIAVYYGAADTYLAVAYTKVDEIIDYLKNNSELIPGDEKDLK